MKIAFLGLGKMGAPMARHLLTAGHQLTIWNRDATKTAELTDQSATAASSPAEAAEGKEVILSMLFDDAANEAVLLGHEGALSTLAPGALHIASSTVSVAFSKRLATAHVQRGQQYVAAPVFGRPNVAAEGKLWIALSGSEDAVAKARPILGPLSRGVTVVGSEPWQAHALKLGGNLMITSMVQTMAETFVYAKAQGIDPEVFLNTVNSALFQSPFYSAYAGVMLHPPEPPGATVALGLKDTKLFLAAAAQSGIRSGLAEYLQAILEYAVDAGLGDGDWAVGQYRTAERKAYDAPVLW